ncbi:MAG: bifunctional glutamate N-acetyltransferase/amino-acid acetyltransferase ArgJ [Oscillospiraceae bacterium]|jgi:glutamate N-acetyltransferase/amino-acid N-acetyltransferase|nr:bifunctional glutamate N-acetyltransferase/amino-acid acetyltransferase ArgJ [Oscillospiraceae bacterium]
MVTFDGFIPADGGVCAAKGFTAGGVNIGVKKGSEKKDLALVYCVKKCAAAAVYTTNKVQGAPITVTKRNLESTKGYARAIVANSGNANTCNPNGVEIAEKICKLTAETLRIEKEDVIIASTGVIGQPLSFEPFETGLPVLAAEISELGGDSACDAIMTTDTFRKQFAVEFELGGVKCSLGGISKGSGMINPNMATLLAFITTDANISVEMLKTALNVVNSVTYNMVCVDGDTSTNDMVCVMASGLAGNKEIVSEDADYEIFVNALYAVMVNLARETARDGEGATKLLECIVRGAPDEEVAKSVAKSVISSNLFKAAMSAADANWGRILCAIGYAEGGFDISKTEVELASSYGRITVCKNGAGVSFSEEEAFKLLSEDEIRIYVDLRSGEGEAVAWGCDLTGEYVKINANYRS